MTDAQTTAIITGCFAAGSGVLSAVVVGIFNRSGAKKDKKDIVDRVDHYTVKVDGQLKKFIELIGKESYARATLDEKTRSDAGRGSKM